MFVGEVEPIRQFRTQVGVATAIGIETRIEHGLIAARTQLADGRRLVGARQCHAQLTSALVGKLVERLRDRAQYVVAGLRRQQAAAGTFRLNAFPAQALVHRPVFRNVPFVLGVSSQLGHLRIEQFNGARWNVGDQTLHTQAVLLRRLPADFPAGSERMAVEHCPRIFARAAIVGEDVDAIRITTVESFRYRRWSRASGKRWWPGPSTQFNFASSFPPPSLATQFNAPP